MQFLDRARSGAAQEAILPGLRHERLSLLLLLEVLADLAARCLGMWLVNMHNFAVPAGVRILGEQALAARRQLDR